MSAWREVTRREPCAVCGKPDWCGVSADGSAACCMRVQSEKPARNGGFIHKLGESTEYRRGWRSTIAIAANSPAEFAKLAEQYRNALPAGELLLLARRLGVSADALRRMHVGWDGQAHTFPMCNAAGGVCGIRRRFADGKKLSVVGGREGLFIPEELGSEGELCVCEGPTDTAALLSLDFDCIGRPSCRGAMRMCADFCRGRDVVIVADGDGPGIIGAQLLARQLVLHCPSVKTIRPPVGIKDVRQWVIDGATREDVLSVISAAAAPMTCKVEFSESR